MEYIHSFASETEYNEYLSSNNFKLPNVAYIEGSDTLHSKPQSNPFGAYEYVDFGLPSGLLWAKCNVVAATETDYGDYFMWGDPEPATNRTCNWANYKWRGSVETTYSDSGMTKYNHTDGLTTLELSDDAARVNMGGQWRMPTLSEVQELTANTTNAWVTNYQGSGKKGKLLTGKGIYTGTTLFFPACGNRNGTAMSNIGSVGYVWSSSLNQNSKTKSNHLYVTSSSINIGTNNSNTNRCFGFTIRGVINPIY